jgi:tetratricopeptide (TPR) repeat protein
MDQVFRHHSAKQYKQALQLLDTLEKTHPHSAWVKNIQAFTLMMDMRCDEAKVPLIKVLQVQPDNLYSIALFGLVSFLADGWTEGKTAIQRSFQRTSAKHPLVNYFLAHSIADFMKYRGCPLAYRDYLGIALRLANEQQRQKVFMELADFDGDTKIPYILRGSHDLVPVAGDAEFEKEVRKGARLSFLGCHEAAAELFSNLAERSESQLGSLEGDAAVAQRARTAKLWWNTGLCRARDGDEQAAAEALHRSAQYEPDFELAVECETLAQTLHRSKNREAVHRVVEATYKVQTVSKLLSVLDETPNFVRMPQPEDSKPDSGMLVASYRVLDKAIVTGHDPAAYSLEKVPRVVADIYVFARGEDEDSKSALVIFGIEGDLLTEAIAKLEAAGGDELEKVTNAKSQDSLATRSILDKEFLPLRFKRHFEPSTSPGIIRRVTLSAWTKFLDEEWPETPLLALGGKTARQAAGDESLRVPLAACIQQLDMYADRYGLPFDLNAQRAKYQLPAVTPLEVNEMTNIGALSTMQFARLPFDRLSNDQLTIAFKRAILVQHKQSLRPLLLTIVQRTEVHKQVNLSRVYRFLSDLSALSQETDQAIHWLNQERSRELRENKKFEHELEYDLRELRYRLDDPHSDACNQVLRRIWDRYGSKLPELRHYVSDIVDQFKVSAAWMLDGSVNAGAEGGAVTSGGVWTPDAAAANPAGESKLWLPGQS